MKQLLESAVSRLEIDTDSLVAGGAARGRVRRRRRRLLAGVGSAAAVGMVATGAVLLPGLGTGEIAQEADFADPAGSAAVVQDQRLLSLQQVLDGLRSDSAAAAPTAPDVPLAMHNDAIRDQLASMLSVGEVGPILTRKQNADYAQSDAGTDKRGLFLTYDGTETQFVIVPAYQGGCEAWLSAARTDSSRSYGTCQAVGEATVVTEEYAEHDVELHRSVIAWSHGYQISVASTNMAPIGPDFYPAENGKLRDVVTDQPPIDLATLTEIATSDVWFG